MKGAQTTDPVAAASLSGARRLRLLESAERLIGIYGVEGVSLRQICVEAGYRNHYSIQHHFGDKLTLVDAILSWRTPVVEAARREGLARLEQQAAAPSLAQVLGEMFVPIIEIVNGDGDRTYARLLLRLSYLGHGGQQPRWHHPSDVARQMHAMLHDRLRHLPEQLFRDRLAKVAIMFLDMVVNQDLARSSGLAGSPAKLELEDTLHIAAAAISADVTPAVLRHYQAMVAPPER